MFEAVIGYTEDEEIATWGTGDTAEAAILDAVEQFVVDCHDYIEHGGYEVTVYDEPLTRERPDGDGEVYGWLRRGKATVTLCTLIAGFPSMGWQWVSGDVVWDDAEATP